MVQGILKIIRLGMTWLRSERRKVDSALLIVVFSGILFPIMLILNVLASSFSDKFMKDILGKSAYDMIHMYLVRLSLTIWLPAMIGNQKFIFLFIAQEYYGE